MDKAGSGSGDGEAASLTHQVRPTVPIALATALLSTHLSALVQLIAPVALLVTTLTVETHLTERDPAR
ncbi:hypothetical protein GCM10010317_002830 [Streptomyces mirabilis]|uniref:hypothetical protein n=1 Tax=Streptomyces mirabilis TaxID=68239 RepID=UPI00167D5FFB|nr:hypothetical protein [Streptomyces mirabilis]GHD37407.1 hypothetical protein GCM10010317_002830 [Streptomyces mirabilis]